MHCLNINNLNKCEKYGLNSMMKSNDLSSKTNIRKENRIMNYY